MKKDLERVSMNVDGFADAVDEISFTGLDFAEAIETVKHLKKEKKNVAILNQHLHMDALYKELVAAKKTIDKAVKSAKSLEAKLYTGLNNLEKRESDGSLSFKDFVTEGGLPIPTYPTEAEARKAGESKVKPSHDIIVMKKGKDFKLVADMRVFQETQAGWKKVGKSIRA